MDIISLVFGIMAVVFGCNPCLLLTGSIFGILAVVFGIIGIVKNKDSKGKAIAGIITGALGLILNVTILLIIINTIQDIIEDIPGYLQKVEIELRNYLNATMHNAVDSIL